MYNRRNQINTQSRPEYLTVQSVGLDICSIYRLQDKTGIQILFDAFINLRNLEEAIQKIIWD